MSSTRLHDCLYYLRGPKSFTSDIPLDDLSTYLSNLFSHANLIANSVPPPNHWSSLPNSASNPSPHSSSTPLPPTDESQNHFWPNWGKPLKISAKDNPLNIPVHKMAGSDRHGAWFARRSVHRGLRFAQWKRCMQHEFAASMEVQGEPGAGAVRGIAADQRVEERVVNGVGKLQVWQLSAAFPGPVAPREFVAMTASTDRCSDYNGGEGEDGVRSNQYMVVSIPVDHPDAAPRNGLVRGFFESVEVIRQVELGKKDGSRWSNKQSRSATNLLSAEKPVRSRSTSRQRSGTISYAESRGPDAKGEKVERAQEGLEGEDADDDGTAVEWIMITRSDPGGGIPRFMVERHTPASITQDAVKFLNWAVKQEELIEEDEEMEKQGIPAEERERRLSVRRESLEEARFSPVEANGHLAGVVPPSSGHGIIASLTAVAENALEAYTPNVIREGLEPWLSHPRPTNDANNKEDEDNSTETSSLGSFESAQQYYSIEDHSIRDSSSSNIPTDSMSGLDMKGSQTSEEATVQEVVVGDDKHYKELEKLERRRKELEARFEKQRQVEAKKSEDISHKEARVAEKARERHEKEIKKQKEKYDREVKKLEEKREREAKRHIERQKKAQERDGLAKIKRDRDEFKSQVDILRKENELLRAQVLELQRENTMLVKEVGKLDGGSITLRTVKDEIKKGSRNRGSSVGSKESRMSKGSRESYPSKGSNDSGRNDAAETAEE